MKSKIPCPPAFIPVIRFDQATGLCGGTLVVRRRNDPCSASRAKFGILPSAMNFVSRSGSSPSTPRIIIFRDPTAPPRACWQETSRLRAAPHNASRHTSRRRFLKGTVTTNNLQIIWSSFTEGHRASWPHLPGHWLTMGGDHDITTRLGIPRSRSLDCTRSCTHVKTAHFDRPHFDQ